MGRGTAGLRCQVPRLCLGPRKLSSGVLAYKICILPVPFFAAQLEDLPPHWPVHEERAVQKLRPGPWKWLPLGVARNLKQLGLPMDFLDLEILVPAMRLRVAGDLKGKGCDPRQLHTALQKAFRGANVHDQVVRDRLGFTTHKVEAEILRNRGQTAIRISDKERIVKKSFRRQPSG